MKPESVFSAIETSKKLIASYKKAYGENAEPNASYKIRISPKTQEELLALIAILTLNEIKLDAIDVHAPFITSKMTNKNPSSGYILRSLNYTLEHCQSEAMKAYDRGALSQPSPNKEGAVSSRSADATRTNSRSPNTSQASESTLSASSSFSTLSQSSLEFSDIEKSWKKLNFENFDIKRLQDKWFTLLMGETVEDWTAHIKETLSTLDAQTAEGLRSDVLSLSLYMEKAKKTLSNTQQWLEAFETTEEKTSASQQFFRAKRTLWENQWNHAATGGWSAALSESNEFLEQLTQLKAAIMQYSPSLSSGLSIEPSASSTVSRTSDKDKAIKHSDVASVIHQRQGALLGQLTKKLSERRIEAEPEVKNEEVYPSSFMRQALSQPSTSPILIQKREIHNAQQCISETEALKQVKIKIPLEMDLENNSSSLLLSEAYVKSSKQKARLFYWTESSEHGQMEMGLRFAKDTLSTTGALSTSLDEKRAQALGVLDMISHLLIQMRSTGQEPSYEKRIEIQSSGNINELNFIRQALLALDVPPNAIHIHCENAKRKTTLEDSRFIQSLGENATQIIEQVKRYISHKVAENATQEQLTSSRSFQEPIIH